MRANIARVGRSTYVVVLVLFGGSALGFFGYLATSRTVAPWVFSLTGIAVTAAAAWWWLRGRVDTGPHRWVIHLLWLPVALFVALMVAVIIALRDFE